MPLNLAGFPQVQAPVKRRCHLIANQHWRPEHIISGFTRSQLAAVIATTVLPNMDLVFTTTEILDYMEQAFGLDASDLPTVSQGKPGRRMRWRQQASDALTILLNEKVLEMVSTRRYRKVTIADRSQDDATS